MRKFRAIFAGGGTGGHLTPARAIADHLKTMLRDKVETEFLFVGTKRGLEYRIREDLGYPLALINIRGLSRSLSLSNLLFPFLLIGAVLKSMSLISEFRPDIVIGTGGYVMGPVILAAWLKGTKRVIQEQNSFPGLATRKLAKVADRVFIGFEDARRHLPVVAPTVQSGNPVKDIIGTVSREEGIRHFELDPEKKTIMIMGGSQGAANINKNIIKHISDLHGDLQIIWQTGERDYKEVTAQAGGKVSRRSLFPFTDRIEMAYAASDLIIARAGALTLAELAAAGVPAILVPYPYATGNHQMKNAESFAANGAAVVIADSDLEKVNLIEEAERIIEQGRLADMSRSAKEHHLIEGRRAVDIICNEILELTEFNKE